MNIYPQYLEDTLHEFQFLVKDHGFVLTRTDILNAGVFLTYTKDDRHVKLGFEKFEERFFYSLVHEDKHVMFHDFFQRCEPSISWPQLMPTFDEYKAALEKNVRLLKQYGSDFLSGKEAL